MNRLRRFAVIAAAATVAGLAGPVTVAAARAPAHAAHSRHKVPVLTPHSAMPVQWSSDTTGRATGLVHYPGGALARITQHRSGPATPAEALREAARSADGRSATVRPASERRPARPALTAADVPTADQARLGGRVTDSQHQPLTGVEVEAFAPDADEPTASTSTNSNGRYVLTLAPGDYYVGFDGSNATGGNSDATGYVGTSTELQLAAGDHLFRNARLQPGAALRVRVTDAAGHPLAGVGPYLQPIMPYVQTPTGGFLVSFSVESNIVTGADGTYTFRGLPSDAAQVCFTTFGQDVTGGSTDALGYADRCSRHPIAPAPGSSTEFRTVRLSTAAGGALHGVVATAGRHPLAGALVDAESRVAGAAIETNDNGSYRLTGLPPGHYRVCAFSPSPAPTELGYAPSCASAEVARGKVHRADLALHRGGVLTGTVTGPSGAPVADVGVDVTGAGPNGGFAVTDADGKYSVNGLATGTYRVCFDTSEAVDPDSPTGDRDGCYQHKAQVAVHAGRQRHHIDTRLRLGGAVAGQVTGSGGVGLGDVDVLAISTAESKAGGEAVTDAHGNYAITGLPAGSYELCFLTFDPSSGGGAQKCAAAAVDVQIGRTSRQDESFAPPASRGTIAVAVRDEQGNRVQGVDVGVLKPCGRSYPFLCGSEPLFGHAGHAKLVASQIDGVAGGARIEDRKPGHYAVCLFAYYGVTTAGASSAGYSDRCAGRVFSVAVRSGETAHVRLTLHPGGRVEGRVVDPAGQPVPHVQVLVAHSAAADYVNDTDVIGDVGDPFGTGSPQSDALTHRDGTFSVRGVRPGSDKECAEVALGRKYISGCAAEPITVTAAATAHAPDLVLRKGGAISGAVHDAAGHPLHRAEVGVFTTGPHTEAAGFALPDRHGRYRVRGLAPGRYVVCFIAPGRVAVCYQQVPWHLVHNPTHLAGITKVRVTRAHTTKGIDAELRRAK